MFFLKPLAAMIGYSFYGFFGGVLGWFAGGIASMVISDGPKVLLPGGRQAIQAQRQTVFLKTLFLLMGKLAKVDSQVSQSEIDHVEQFMLQMGMSGEHRQQAIGYFQDGVKDTVQMEATLANFLEVCGSSLQMKHLLLVYLSGIALADGELHPSEHSMLQQVAAKFGYNERAFEQLMLMIQGQNRFRESAGHQHGQGAKTKRATNTLEEAYQALGVTVTDSDKDIKRAYRKLISQYHPDKLIGQGVPEDMINKATERSKEIHAAYDLIVDYRKGG